MAPATFFNCHRREQAIFMPLKKDKYLMNPTIMHSKIYNDFDEARFGELHRIKGIDGKIHSSDKLCHENKIH